MIKCKKGTMLGFDGVCNSTRTECEARQNWRASLLVTSRRFVMNPMVTLLMNLKLHRYRTFSCFVYLAEIDRVHWNFNFADDIMFTKSIKIIYSQNHCLAANLLIWYFKSSWNLKNEQLWVNHSGYSTRTKRKRQDIVKL